MLFSVPGMSRLPVNIELEILVVDEEAAPLLVDDEMRVVPLAQ